MTTNKIRDVLIDLLLNTPDWCRRHDIAWYVGLCERKGYCKTDDLKRACALRYLAGKRKVSPPGHRRKKKAAKDLKRALSNIPAELLVAMEEACKTSQAEQYLAGNEKALNALVGMVMKTYKFNAAAVRELIVNKLKENNE